MPKEDTQFKAGVSGNPNGRPKKEYCLTDILKEQGNQEDVELKTGGKITRKQAIAKKLWAMAMDGDIVAMKYVYDRIDGRPLQQIEADVKSDTIVQFVKDYEGL